MEQRARGADFFGLIFLVFLTLFFTGCGGKFDAMASLDFTEVRFGGSNGLPSAAVNLMDFFSNPGLLDVGDLNTQVVDGGIMVYATRVGDGFFVGRRYLSSEGATTWTLPNGAYHFHAVGYSASNMTGTKYCGVANGDSGPGTPVNLIGNAKTVNLSLTPSVAGSLCRSQPFQDYLTLDYNSLTVRICDTLASPLSSCTGTSNFSMQFAISARDEFLGPRPYVISDPGLVGACNVGGTGSATINFPAFPLGSLDQARQYSMRSEIRFYTGSTACSGSFKRLVFPFGLAPAGLLGGQPTAIIDDVPRSEHVLMTLATTTDPVLYLYFAP